VCTNTSSPSSPAPKAANAKSKKPREIPLDDETLDILAKLREAAKQRQPVEGVTLEQSEQQKANFSREHVFVTKANTPLRNNLLKRFYSTCKRANIDGAYPNGGVDIHSLRGTFITISIDHGASPKAIQEIVGHATLAMTMNTYAKATDRSKRDAVGKLPFATVSTPTHIVKLPKAGTNRAQVDSERTQSKAV
jgi:integrase